MLALQLDLLLAHADVGFLQRGAGPVYLGQRVLDRADRGDRRHIQSHLHELRVALMEVAGVPHDGRHPLLDVLQHRAVFRLCDGKSRRHVAQNQIIAQGFLLFVGVSS